MKLRNILQKFPALTVFLFALAARVLVLAVYFWGGISGSLKGGDSILYFEIAHNLIAGNGFSTSAGPTAFVSPLYPYFLASCISIAGENVAVISLVQIFLGALACVYIYKITLLVFCDITIALLGGFLAAINFEILLWANAQLLTEAIYFPLFAASILALIASVKIEEYRLTFTLISAALFALTSLTRPISIGVVGVLFFLIFFAALKTKGAQLKFPLIFLAIFAVVLLPWGIRNYYVMGSFTISSLEGGHVLWLGNNAEYDKYEDPQFTEFGGYTVMFKRNHQLTNELNGKTEAEANLIYAKTAKDHIFAYPYAFAVRGVHKNWNMWRPNFSGSSFRNNLVSFTIYPILLFSALIGMFFAIKAQYLLFPTKESTTIFILIAIFGSHLLIHSVITGEIRFRVPIWIVMLPFSSLAIIRLFRFFFRARLN